MKELSQQEIHANRVKWLEALESGKFDQTQGTLSEPVFLAMEETGFRYCCLGVWCKVSNGWGTYDDRLGNKLSTSGRASLDMSMDEMDQAVLMNDGEEEDDGTLELNDEGFSGRSFEYIARYFREKWNIPKEV